MEISSNKQVTIMKISSQEFRDSFYYIAPGKDFEPLLRYSNQCSQFFYANLYMDKEEILGYVDRYFKNNFFLELLETTFYDDFDETTHFELHPQYGNHLNNIKFLGAASYRDYQNAFVSARKNKQWMIRLRILRKHVKMELVLYYFTGEGLASYIALSHNGLYQPKVLCTVETKLLEVRKEIMLRLFEQVGSSPEQWIRGFQGEQHFDGSYYIPDDNKNNALKPDEVYNTIGMGLGFQWNTEGSYRNEIDFGKQTTRLCKVFIKKQTAEQIASRPFRKFSNHRVLYGDLYKIAREDSDSEKWIIATNHFDLDRLGSIPNTRVLTWEKALQPKGEEIYKCSLTQSLAKLEKLISKAQGKIPGKIYFVPFGMEDEGEILADFLGSFAGPQLNVVVNHPLDLIDLRASA